MAGSRIPGSLGIGNNMPTIDKGTNARIASPPPGPLGLKKDQTQLAIAQSDINASDAGAKRLREIRNLVRENNQSSIDDNVIICQIYMESRFDANAKASGSTARGLMQLLKAPVRELYRIRNLKKPKSERQSDEKVFAEADRFHDSDEFVDEATNIQTGTEYLQYLIDKETNKGGKDPITEAYKDYRGVRNGIYYNKIKRAADQLAKDPNSMQPLLDMVK